ncbi:uncharacterized protein J4E88_006531 [Alternaria novae-zelandiae]|uniref:uncharacterized protein n=1 Tax=Alternaria novae-zelandiae TaxID=430562 RepID=UPI0020C2357D|nr:uncharacterized protein J4E88_006531 [Alternaria novae-zelandiae]KAI4678013.1 hypothetical protein J4E88_006531 [Alternaria novae-zelandiae]
MPSGRIDEASIKTQLPLATPPHTRTTTFRFDQDFDHRPYKHPATGHEADTRTYELGMPAPEIKKSDEATRRYLADTRRDEVAKMVICEGIQREVVALDSRAKYWGERAAHYQTWGDRRRQRLHARTALNLQEVFDKSATARDAQFELEINILLCLTRLRKLCQRQLRMAPTRVEYIYNGNTSNRGERFVLLDPEVDSATSVQNYMDTRMAGSSLFANEL